MTRLDASVIKPLLRIVPVRDPRKALKGVYIQYGGESTVTATATDGKIMLSLTWDSGGAGEPFSAIIPRADWAALKPRGGNELQMAMLDDGRIQIDEQSPDGGAVVCSRFIAPVDQRYPDYAMCIPDMRKTDITVTFDANLLSRLATAIAPFSTGERPPLEFRIPAKPRSEAVRVELVREQDGISVTSIIMPIIIL